MYNNSYRSRSRDRDRDGGHGDDKGDKGEPQTAAEWEAERQKERERERKNHKSRRRKPSIWWDVAPRGFEHISPLQYKAMQGILYESSYWLETKTCTMLYIYMYI